MTENYPEALATNASPVARTAIVVLGAGSGTRLKEKMPKAAVDVHGKTLLYWALERARASGIAERLVVTVPPDCAHRCPQLLADAAEFDALVTEGGNTRTASVIAALDALAAACLHIAEVLGTVLVNVPVEASVAEQITDDAMAVEAYGERVHTVTGHTDAFKITTPLDLRIARALYPTAPESACS